VVQQHRVIPAIGVIIAVIAATLTAFVGTAAAATAPGAPTIGTATGGIGQATVSWTAPASDGGSPITGYVVTPFVGFAAKPSTTFNSTATTQTVTGLTNGTTYKFKVAAINAIGTGPLSTLSNAVTPATVPDAPMIGLAFGGIEEATVSWTAPAFNGGSAITGYVVTPYIDDVADAPTSFNSTATTQTVTGLINGTTYRFRVQAINVVGTSGQSAESNSIKAAPEVPGAPTIGSATGGISQATVTWTAPASDGGSPITGYEVTPYIESVAQASTVFNSTDTTQTVTGLTNSVKYTFTVAAINSVGFGSSSGASNEVTPATVPNAPTIGSATAGSGKATVSWTTPSFDGGSPITGYVVTPYVGFVARPARTFFGPATTQIVTGLTQGTTYRFRVQAFNAVGVGGFSMASNAVTPHAMAPDAPTIGIAIAGNGDATVSWTAPAFSGGSPITGYVVTPYIDAVAQTATTFNSTATTQTVSGLTNGSTYTFKVAAKNAIGTGPQSDASNDVTPVGAPTAPMIGMAVRGNAQATVSWTAPVSDGGSPITGYVVTPFVGFFAQPSTTFDSTATTQTVTGLTNGTSYRFKVAAINAIGTGPSSMASNPVIPATVPDAPTDVFAFSGNAEATVSWTAPSNGGVPITSYVVIPYNSGVPQTPVTFNSSNTMQTVTGLTNGTMYTFTVAATNAVGTGVQSVESNPVVPATVPDAPLIGTATAGTEQATVSWTTPASDGGSAIIAYSVTPYIDGVAQPAVFFAGTATTQTVTGLSNDTTYRFRVQAVNGVGTSGQSGASNSVTVTPAVAGAPTIGTASAGNGEATVSWTAPAFDGGSPITGYEVTPYIGTVAQTATVFDSTDTTQTVTGLTNGTTYKFTVAAVNELGFSGQSAKSNAVIPATVPDAPTIGTATAGNTQATVSWTAPASNGGLPVTSYVVTPYVNAVAQTPAVFNSTATTQTVTGLTNGTAYTFTVAATNGIGTGAESAPSNEVTPATVPDAPTIGTATAGNTQATVSWTAPVSDGGLPVTAYRVTAYVGVNPVLNVTFNSTATTQTVTGLTNGTTYRFRVRAVNAIGNSAFSTASNAVTPAPSAPDAPTIGTATAGNAQATVTWTAPAFNGNSPITGYAVTPYIASVPQTAVTFNSTATTQTVTGLSNGTTYTFTVAAINAVGTGAQSAESNAVTPATVPGAPTIGTATAGSGQATLSWTAPASDGGSPITGYVVTPFVGFAAKPSTTFNSTATTQTVTGLTNGTTYRFKVQAINAVGTGAMSTASNAVTPS